MRRAFAVSIGWRPMLGCVLAMSLFACTTEDVDVEQVPEMTWPGRTPMDPICGEPPIKASTAASNIDGFEAGMIGAAPANVTGDSAFSGGWFQYHDGTGTLTYGVAAGGHESAKALNYKLEDPLNWGGGVGMYIDGGCLDASYYDGLRFWAKGTVPTNVEFGVGTFASTQVLTGGSCELGDDCIDFVYPLMLEEDEWTLYEVRWEDFIEGNPEPLDPSGITGIRWVFPMDELGDVDFYVDDVAFLKD